MTPRKDDSKFPVRVARERIGLTREQLAVKAGVGSTTVFLAESVGKLSEPIAKKLAKVLGVEAGQLLGTGATRAA